ncbi:MAG: hypothetical protein K2N87_11130 [Eubacterium sp.]|nr:hypothetical protein [Eubacterium sp.]
MYINLILLVVLIITIGLVIYFAKIKMQAFYNTALKRDEVLSLIVNCNNYKPIGDVFSSLDKLLEENQQTDGIEYRGHF